MVVVRNEGREGERRGCASLCGGEPACVRWDWSRLGSLSVLSRTRSSPAKSLAPDPASAPARSPPRDGPIRRRGSYDSQSRRGSHQSQILSNLPVTKRASKTWTDAPDNITGDIRARPYAAIEGRIKGTPRRAEASYKSAGGTSTSSSRPFSFESPGVHNRHRCWSVSRDCGETET